MKAYVFSLAAVCVAGGLIAMAMSDNPSSPTTQPTTRPMNTMKATFGAGCFWGVQSEFDAIPGVVATSVGYSGGHAANPTYKMVCNGDTGHAEVVQVEYDPAQVSYDRLLEAFFALHDPTQRNRQGPDIGDQYRSAVFFHTPEQEAAARSLKAKLDSSGKFRRPIATVIEPASTFYAAEDYHQKYLEKRGMKSCHTR